MSEKNFRIVLGTWLVLGLLVDSPHVIYALVALLLFEGVTNLRVPGVLAGVRAGAASSVAEAAADANPNARVAFEAERGLRLIVATLILIPMSGVADFLWFLPWFVGFALIGAGLSGICPMVLALRWLGLR